MPYSQQQHQHHSSIGLLANVADHQERQYRRYIEQNETMGTGIAMRLARGEQLEGLLGNNNNNNDDDDDDDDDFAGKCRETLKVLAADNVVKERQLKAYVAAIRVVIQNASDTTSATTTTTTTNNTNNNDDGKENNATNEFKEQMETEYAKALHTIEQNSVLITQEPSYLKLCKQLGEDEDEDDELAVVNDHGAKHGASGIKCPLTMAIMEDPVRSRVCKHSFDRHAIVAHLRRFQSCPVPGCGNHSMTIAELEDDPETTMRVRRYKKRESATKKARAQSAIDMDDDDDDDDAFDQF